MSQRHAADFTVEDANVYYGPPWVTEGITAPESQWHKKKHQAGGRVCKPAWKRGPISSCASLHQSCAFSGDTQGGKAGPPIATVDHGQEEEGDEDCCDEDCE